MTFTFKKCLSYSLLTLALSLGANAMQQDQNRDQVADECGCQVPQPKECQPGFEREVDKGGHVDHYEHHEGKELIAETEVRVYEGEVRHCEREEEEWRAPIEKREPMPKGFHEWNQDGVTQQVGGGTKTHYGDQTDCKSGLKLKAKHHTKVTQYGEKIVAEEVETHYREREKVWDEKATREIAPDCTTQKTVDVVDQCGGQTQSCPSQGQSECADQGAACPSQAQSDCTDQADQGQVKGRKHGHSRGKK